MAGHVPESNRYFCGLAGETGIQANMSLQIKHKDRAVKRFQSAADQLHGVC